MFLLKLNFFSYLLSLIISLFQLALNTGLHSHLTIWIFCFDELTSLNPSILSNLIFLGDFNINFFSTSSSKTKLDVISDTFDLKQIINAPTHFSHTDTPSIIDLVFLPSNINAPSCSILSPISFSDDFSILLSLPTDYVNSPSPFPPSRSSYIISLTFSVLILFFAPLTGKNYFPCQILTHPGPYIKKSSSAL